MKRWIPNAFYVWITSFSGIIQLKSNNIEIPFSLFLGLYFLGTRETFKSKILNNETATHLFPLDTQKVQSKHELSP